MVQNSTSLLGLVDHSRPLHPRSLGELFGEAVQLYQRHFFAFVTIAAIVNVPMCLLNVLWTPFLAPHTFESLFELIFGPIMDPMGSGAILVVVFVVPILLLVACLILLGSFSVGYSLLGGVFAKAVSDVYQGKPVSTLASYQFVIRRRGGALVLSALSWLVFFPAIGLVLFASPVSCLGVCLFVPVVLGMMYLAMYCSLYPQAMVLENLAVLEAFTRSWHLTQRALLRTLGLALVPYLFSLAATVGFSAMFICSFAAADPDAFLLSALVGLGWNLLAGTLFQPFVFTLVTLYYYDLRVRKEGFDPKGMPREPIGLSDGAA